MKRHLKDSVIEHLESVQLDERRLAELESLQQRRDGAPRWRVGLAATAFLVALVAVLMLPKAGPDPALLVADEAALNHLQRRPLEVHGDTIAAVEAYFDELGFRLLDSPAAMSDAALLGGRYCSVQGITAAQLRRRDQAGRMQTLYQVPYDAGRFGPMPDISRGQRPRTVQVRGLHVDLWVERGILFALARE